MKKEEKLIALSEKIRKKYEEQKNQGDLNSNNIFRGHIPSVSSIIENEIALFLREELNKKYKYYIDYGIQKHRPDLLVVDENNTIKYIIEIKSNIGYCREIKGDYLKKLKEERELFRKNEIINISYTTKDGKKATKNEVEVKGNPDVKMFFIILTSDNASLKYHENNIKNLKKENIGYYVLFKNWYGDLDFRIDETIENDGIKLLEFLNNN